MHLRAGSLLLAAVFSADMAFAQAPAAPETKAPRPKPSGLTGNALPFCEMGTYVAGHVCKPAPPGFYAPSGTRYPVRCPEGKTSPAGARGIGDCK
jgi:hypothetical protein